MIDMSFVESVTLILSSKSLITITLDQDSTSAQNATNRKNLANVNFAIIAFTKIKIKQIKIIILGQD